MRALSILSFFFLCLSTLVYAQKTDITLTVLPSVSVPLGPSVKDEKLPLYSTGAGGSIRAEFAPSFARFSFIRGFFDYDVLPLNNSKKSVSFLSLGSSVGLSFSPNARISLRLATGGGLYMATAAEGSVRNPFWEVGSDMLLRFSPSFAATIGAKYKSLLLPKEMLYDGISVQLGMAYNLAGGKKGTELRFEQNLTPIFPLFYTYYANNPFGEVLFTNDETITLEKVKIEFFARQYMDSPRLCAEYASIPAGASREVPVYGLFNNAIFRVTEGTKAAGEFRIEYYYLGKKMEKVVPATLIIQNRNAMTWDDDRKAAAFVTAKDPAVLNFAKIVASMVRADGTNPAISVEFRTAVAIYQALKTYGMGYTVDPTTPFLQLSENAAEIDFLQFPNQTLAYKAGDCDDLSVLYAALLESVGIETALVTTPGHIFVAFNTGLSPMNAQVLFENPSDMIIRNDKVWIPVEITLMKDGFNRSWAVGVNEWRDSVANKTEGFYPVREAWALYEPVGFAEGGIAIIPPSTTSIQNSYRSELISFSKSQIAQRETSLKADIKAGIEAEKSANKLGVLYAQFGFLEEARAQFKFAINKSAYTPSLINLGNVEYLTGRYEDAKKLYERVLAIDPLNEAALAGLALTLQAMGDTTGFRTTLDRLQKANAAVAARYFGSASVQRASSASIREIQLWNAE